ncbi:Transcription initiation factor IIA subunit 2 [Cystobasidiomycetes sp. EMM_F5]
MASSAGAGGSNAAGNANNAAAAANLPPQYYQLYRRSSIGMALMDALDELIESGHIPPQLAKKVVDEFDKQASLTVTNQVRAKCTVKAKLQVYRLCDEVWTFSLRDATFKLDGGDLLGPVSKVKIVAQKGAVA